MKIIILPAIAVIPSLLLFISLTSGCSGSHEDVRVTLCKDLTSTLMDSQQTITWNGIENTFRRPEYVAVKVLFALPERAEGTAVCFFGYETPEEDAMTQSQPLSAYSTLPYKMVLNDEPVTKSVLSDGIKLQQQKLGGKILNSLKQGISDAATQLKKIVERQD